MVYILCLSNALGKVIQLKGFNLVKYLMSPIVLFGLVGCGTINTPDDRVDAIYNTTSAVIKGKNSNCSTGHSDDRKECRKRSKEKINTISESIKKHRRDGGV